eukprot:s14003_g1.t1
MLQYPFRTVLRAQWSAVSACMILTLYPSWAVTLARQVGFPGAGVARQQQAFAFEAVEHGVLRDLPVHRAAIRTLGLDSGDPVLALEALDLLAPVHGRAVGVSLADQAVHEALELFGQVLEDDAVRFHGLKVLEGADDAVLGSRRHRHSLMLRTTTLGQCLSARSSLRVEVAAGHLALPLPPVLELRRFAWFLSPRYLAWARSPIGSHLATVRADL